MNVRALKLRDGHFPNFWQEVDPHWDYDDFKDEKGREYFNNWISFDCLLADSVRNIVWCGIATFSGDIFYAYDRQTGTFRSLNFKQVGDEYDAKFHRALMFDKEGIIWAATAMLHDPMQYMDAPGGAIVRFDPNSEVTEIVSRPLPHTYIQSLAIDRERGILYGQTYMHDLLFRFDISTQETRVLGSLGINYYDTTLSQAENIAVDKNGTLWGCYATNRAWGHSSGLNPYRLFRYHPDQDQLEFLKYGLPAINGSGWDKIDGMITGADGAVYASTPPGLLCRIDPDNGKIEKIGVPGTGKLQRLSALISGPDDNIYGVSGKGGLAELFSLDLSSVKFTNWGPIYDEQINTMAWQIHDLAIMEDGTIYAGENDVPHRSSYLWEITGVI